MSRPLASAQGSRIELASLAAVEAALHTAIQDLIAIHPELLPVLDDDTHELPPQAAAAWNLIELSCRLFEALATYRSPYDRQDTSDLPW